MGFLVFIAVVAAIIVPIVIVKKKKAKEAKEQAEIELKSAENKLKNNVVVKEIEDELTKKGYRTEFRGTSSHGDGEFSIYIDVYGSTDTDLGEMSFDTHDLRRSSQSYRSTDFYAQKHSSLRFEELKHEIFLDRAGVIIKSQTHYLKPVPEWMKICADVLRKHCDISLPEMVEYCIKNLNYNPEYVNVVFQ